MRANKRAKVITEMQQLSDKFYVQAVRIGVHPFIEFCGLMNTYINACKSAHARRIDFSDCNTHSGKDLPLEPYDVEYWRVRRLVALE